MRLAFFLLHSFRLKLLLCVTARKDGQSGTREHLSLLRLFLLWCSHRLCCPSLLLRRDSSSEPSVSAAVAAAKLNAMLEAKGKLLKVWCLVFLFEAHQPHGALSYYVNVVHNFIYTSQPAGPAIPSPSNTTSTSDHTQPMVSAEIEINDSEAR